MQPHDHYGTPASAQQSMVQAQRTGVSGCAIAAIVSVVVAILLVLVGGLIFIAGTRKYIANAKTAEARNSVGQIAKDAASAFAREKEGHGSALCGPSTDSVPSSPARIRGMKYQSSPAEWTQGDENNGWQCLRFSMTDPQYYMYSYRSSGASGDVGNTFSAIAEGDLDGDGVLSTIQIDGRVVQALSGAKEIDVAPNLIEVAPEE